MKKFERNQELLDRFTTKAQYKEFLGKKIKDFTKNIILAYLKKFDYLN